MVGNMYGVDIKLTPTQDGPKAIGIELNGVNSGTDFFKYEEGREYYRRFVRQLATATGGKPLFFEANPHYAADAIARAYWEREYIEERDLQKKLLEAVPNIVLADFPLETAWLDDECAFKCAYLGREPEHEEFHYALGAQREGVEAYLYDEVSYDGDHAVFRLHNGGALRVRISDIGAIRSGSDTREAPRHARQLFLNTGIGDITTSLVEDITDNKLLFYFMTTFDPEIRDLWPPHIYYGLGGTSPERMAAFIERTNADLYVRKPGGSSCGVGVDIVAKEELRRQLLRQRRSERPLEDIWQVRSIIANSFFENTLDEYISVYQPFVPSVPIPHPRTGALHDGCARMIVLSLDRQEPVVVGGQWRLAPQPIDDEGASLVQRLRANLSRGAIAAPMDDEAYRLASKCATSIVESYEMIISTFHKVLEESQEAFSKRGSRRIPRKIDILRAKFYQGYLCELSEVLGLQWFDKKDTASSIKERMSHK